MADTPETPNILNYDWRRPLKQATERAHASWTGAAVRMTGATPDRCPICQEIDIKLVSDEQAAIVCEKHKAEFDRKSQQ